MWVNPDADELLTHNAEWAKALAARSAYRMGMSQHSDDMQSVALESLWLSARKWDPTRVKVFRSFASIRIKWAIVDYCRMHTGLARSIGKDSRRALAHRIPEHSHISMDHHQVALATSVPQPDEVMAFKDKATDVSNMVARLPRRIGDAVRMYYWREMSLVEIGAEMGVTDSRVCQLLREGVSMLREAAGRERRT